MKIIHNPPCPFLPKAPTTADYRILRDSGAQGSPTFVNAALRYAQYLWISGYPARAILALCRALYVSDNYNQNIEPAFCPYRAYRWLIQFPNPIGFMGNPRISFQHQTLRMPSHSTTAKRCRAHALWLLTIKNRPDLNADPKEKEPAKSIDSLLQTMSRHCGSSETSQFLKAYFS